MAGVEVERKWLVDAVPDDVAAVPGEAIEQGYLVVGEGGSEVRLRRRGERCLLTAKSGRGLSRTELEVSLSREQFDVLWPGTEGRRLQKTRSKLDAGEGLTIELDVYSGALEGLIIAEVEFPDEQSAERFVPPRWIGQEVTEDDRYRNRSLAVDGRPGS